KGSKTRLRSKRQPKKQKPKRIQTNPWSHWMSSPLLNMKRSRKIRTKSVVRNAVAKRMPPWKTSKKINRKVKLLQRRRRMMTTTTRLIPGGPGPRGRLPLHRLQPRRATPSRKIRELVAAVFDRGRVSEAKRER